MKRIVKLIGSNLLIFVVGYLMCLAGFNKLVLPFFVAFVFAVFFVFNNYFYYIFGLILSVLLFNFGVRGIVVDLNIFLVVVALIFIFKKMGRLKLWALIPFVLLAEVMQVLFSIKTSQGFIISIIGVFVSVVFLYSYILYFKTIKVRGIGSKLTLDELLGLVLLVVPIIYATSKIYMYRFSLVEFILPLCVLLASGVLEDKSAFGFSVILSLGVGFNRLSLALVGNYILVAVSVIVVKKAGKIIQVCTMIVLSLMLGIYFKLYDNLGLIGLLPLTLAGVIYIIIPNKLIYKLKQSVNSEQIKLSLETIVNASEERGIKNQLKQVSSLFYEMHDIYKNMVIGRLDSAQVEDYLYSDVVSVNCKNCAKYQTCHEGRTVIPRVLRELVKKGLNKYSLSIIDIQTSLACACGKTNQIIYGLNQRLGEYKEYSKDIKAEDDDKILMSSSLMGAGEIIEKLAHNFSLSVKLDKRMEEKLINSYLYEDIVVKGCSITNIDGKIKVTLVVGVGEQKRADLERVASTFFKRKMEIVESKYADIAGLMILSLCEASKFSYVVGVSRVAKDKISGDTFTETKLDNGKVLFALSDGKGVGFRANRISEMSLNLIEDFYMAGFSGEHIINNVNKLLSYKSGENFSAVDVVVFDQETGAVDFIKRGGTPSVIKYNGAVEVVEGDNLPIGMLENADTKTQKKYISVGDYVFITSDGVFDAFNTSDNFSGFINNLNFSNIQDLTDAIIKKAIANNGGKVLDDMTVLAFKVLLNRKSGWKI